MLRARAAALICWSVLCIGAPALTAQTPEPPVPLCEQNEIYFEDPSNPVTAPWPNGSHEQSIVCENLAGNNCSDNWGLGLLGGANSQKYEFSLASSDATMRIYILDTGIAGQHREFATRVKPGVNITQKILSPHRFNTLDCYGNSHGSHVSGIAAGNTYGGAKRAWLIPVKLAPDNCTSGRRNGSSNNNPVVKDFVRAIDWIIANHPTGAPGIVSYSANPNEDLQDPKFVEAVQRLAARGILLVESAGNDEGDAGPETFWGPAYPREGVVIVGGLDRSNRRWRRVDANDQPELCPANPAPGTRPDCGSNFGLAVDLWAPAQHIVSVSNLPKPNDPNTRAGICRLSGTSMAAPHVTGVAASLWARYPKASPSAIKEALRQIAFTDVTGGQLRCSELPASKQHLVDECQASTNRRLSNNFPASGPPVAGDDRFYTEEGESIAIPKKKLSAGDFDWGGGTVQVVAVDTPQYGSVQDFGSYLSYTPPAVFQGEDSFTYTIHDASGLAASATVRITVEADLDDPPVAWTDCFELAVGESRDFSRSELMANDWDPDAPGTALTVSSSDFEISANPDPQHGTLTETGFTDILYRFQPVAGFTGTASFRYVFLEPSLYRQGEGTVLLKVGPGAGSCPAPLPPTPSAVDDSFTTTVSTPLSILSSDLLANDTPDAVFVTAAQPQHGVLTISGIAPEGVLYTYTPPAGFAGTDSFEYTIHGNLGVEDTGRVWIQVLGSTTIVANPDVFSTTSAGQRLRFLSTDLTANDTPGVQFIRAENPQHGTLETAGIGPEAVVYDFVPATGFAGTASFEYLISPNGSEPYTRGFVTVEVADAPPSAAFTSSCTGRPCTFNGSGSTDDLGVGTYAWRFGDDTTGSGASPSHTYAARGSYLVTLTVTDTGGQTSTTSQMVIADARPVASFTASCSNGSCTFDASGSTDDGTITSYSWDYGDGTTGSTPSHNYAGGGPRTVVLTVKDDIGQTGSKSLVVYPDELPVARFNWSCVQRTCTFDGRSSTDNQPIVTWEWALGDGNVKYGSVLTHTYAVGGPYNVKLKVTDSVNQWDDEIKPIAVNRPPVANNDSVVTDRNVAIDINVLANDSDPDGDPISVVNWTQPGHGSVAKNANGTMRYTPAAGYTGADSFTYTISDGRGDTAQGTVTLTVRLPNNPPDARDDGWRTYQNGPTNIPYSHLLANDYDPNGDALTVTAINTAGLTGTLDCSSGTWCTYAPPSWFVGTTSFTYSASDGKGGTDPATVRIKVGGTNGLPAPQDDLLEAAYNAPLTFTRATLLVNDSDPDGDVLSVPSVYRAPLTAFGTVSCSAANYVCTYTPPAGFTGVDVLYYRASDGIDFTDARIRILVRPPSPAVLDAREDETFFTTSGTFLSYTWMTSNDYDPEGGALTVVSVDTTSLLGTLDCTTYYNGCQYMRGTSDPTRFRYTVRDPQGNLATTTVTLKPGNASFNKIPVIANDQLATRTNTPLSFSIFDVLRNDYDPDNDQLDVSFYFASTYGRVSCTTPAYFCTYTPNANFTGTDTLTYVANDRNNSVNGTVTMTVQPVVAKDAQVLSQSVPVSMFAGRSYPVSLRIKNVGTQTWGVVGAQCNAFRLGSVNPYDNTTWGASRSELPSTVAPGGEVTVTFNVTAPSTPGTYNFQRRMVHECVEWFGDLSPNVVVTVSP